MSHQLVTNEDLAQARRDPEFRKQLIAANLDHLLEALARLRAGEHASDPESTRQIREGAQLAVKLADLLQRSAANRHSA